MDISVSAMPKCKGHALCGSEMKGAALIIKTARSCAFHSCGSGEVWAVAAGSSNGAPPVEQSHHLSFQTVSHSKAKAAAVPGSGQFSPRSSSWTDVKKGGGRVALVCVVCESRATQTRHWLEGLRTGKDRV